MYKCVPQDAYHAKILTMQVSQLNRDVHLCLFFMTEAKLEGINTFL